MKRSLTLSLLLLLLLVGCGYAVWRPADAGDIPMPPPPADSVEARRLGGFDDDDASGLIARKILFGNPDKSAPKLSPDAKRLAFLAPKDGVLNVWVTAGSDIASAKVVTDDRKRGIRRFFWAYTNQHIVYLQDEGGDENWRAYSVDVDTGKRVDLSALDGVRTEIQEVSHLVPGEILIGLNDRDKRYHDIHRVDITTGKRTLMQQNDGFGGFVTDDRFAVRFARKPTDDGGEEISLASGDGFKPWLKVSMEDQLSTSIVGFDASGQSVYMIDSRGRDTAALNRVRLPDGKPEVLGGDAHADVAGLLLHPTKKTLQAIQVNHLRRRWHFLDAAMGKDFALLSQVARGDVQIESRSLDDRRWTVAFVSDDGPVAYYSFDRDDKKTTKLFVDRPELVDLPLARMHPEVIKTRDRLDMVSYLTLPVGTEGKRPSAPLPMVLLVHGGPWGRDSWGYNSYHQWLANRGYAVLSVNFRGSTGFGKSFVNKSNKEWAGKMHDDLLDAVAWAVAERIAPADKIAIMGGSYGGYSTLVGMTFTPTTFACGVDIVGPSNLVTLLASIPPYWTPYLALFRERVGDHTTDDGKKALLARSPISRVDAIVRPLLIGQGANDPRVKQAESDQIVAAMSAKQIPVTYVLYPDEGHGFRRPENGSSFNAVAEAFLGRCLGGRVQPIGSDFEGASIQVPHGAEHVPGLATALGAR
jgi:dipeptidyl aminopeptidase/acylaminoacyl peptidase